MAIFSVILLLMASALECLIIGSCVVEGGERDGSYFWVHLMPAAPGTKSPLGKRILPRPLLDTYNIHMSKTEILAELPKLKAEERTQVFERLCELQEMDLLQGVGQTAEEKKILDEALAEFQRDGNPGTPWRQTLRRIRSASLS